MAHNPDPAPRADGGSEQLTASVEGEQSALGIHNAVMRETADPNEGYDPGPRWFYAFAVAALAIGGFYLGRHGGEFGTATHIGYLPADGVNATAGAPATPGAVTAVSGKAIYVARCASCHQPDGRGVPGAFPPLVGTDYVTDNPAVTARILLQGMQGPITVAGKPYSGVMPAWGDQLNDAEIAAVITYLRTELPGNSATPVTADFVAGVRAETADRAAPWTAPELTSVPAPGALEQGAKPTDAGGKSS